MFAVLKIFENEKGFLARLKFRFNPPEPKLLRVNVAGGAPFYYLEIYENQCGENYNEIVYALGRCSEYLVLCGNYTLPENKLLNVYRPSKLPQLLLMNSAVSFLDKLRYDKTQFSVGIVDKRGDYTEFIEAFVNRAASVRVVTDCPERYEPVCEKLFDEWGFSLVVSQSFSLIKDCDLTVSPETNTERLYNRSIVYYDKEKKQRNIYKAGQFNLPEEYKKLMPEGVNGLIFASALYELCGVKSIKELKYSNLKLFESI